MLESGRPGHQATSTRGGGAGTPTASTCTGPHAPAISLPKVDGTICGIGKKFAAIPVTGNGLMSVPIAINLGQSAFALNCPSPNSSSTGNGAFGFSWSLCLPSISRKTHKALPQYIDAEESVGLPSAVLRI